MAKRDYDLITSNEDINFLHKEVAGGILKCIWDAFAFHGGQIFMGYASKAYWRGYDRGYEQARLDTEKKKLERKVEKLQEKLDAKPATPPTFVPPPRPAFLNKHS